MKQILTFNQIVLLYFNQQAIFEQLFVVNDNQQKEKNSHNMHTQRPKRVPKSKIDWAIWKGRTKKPKL